MFCCFCLFLFNHESGYAALDSEIITAIPPVGITKHQPPRECSGEDRILRRIESFMSCRSEHIYWFSTNSILVGCHRVWKIEWVVLSATTFILDCYSPSVAICDGQQFCIYLTSVVIMTKMQVVLSYCYYALLRYVIDYQPFYHN